MNYLEAEKIKCKVESYLAELYTQYPNDILGHGVRLGDDGKPEVFVAFKSLVVLNYEVNGVRIVSENREVARLAGGDHKINVYHCTDCKFEFVIVALNKEQNTIDEPSCPECGDSSNVAKIECLDFRLSEQTRHYEVVKGLKPIRG